MWSICRVDENPHGEVTYFEIQAAHCKRDLDFTEARESGFVGPDDELVVIGPDGNV